MRRTMNNFPLKCVKARCAWSTMRVSMGGRWQAGVSISAQIGCTPQTLNDLAKTAEVDSGRRAGIPSEMTEKLKALDRETASCAR